MIPRHRPPFGPLSLLKLGLQSLIHPTRVANIERDIAAKLNVSHAVWLPSARYGITRAIQLATSQAATVYCPAFNCGAVHHAAEETQRPIHYLDCDAHSFLMSGEAGPSDVRLNNGHAVILSEMFGHRFSTAQLSQPLFSSAALRIFDMAMAIPVAADMQRLSNHDVAMLSFGLGKSLYSGWGGMALTNSLTLANDLRVSLQRELKTASKLTRLRTFAKIVARTAAHEPPFYEYARRQTSTTEKSVPRVPFSNRSPEWHRPPTAECLTLLRQNFADSQQYIQHRMNLADAYRHHLPSFLWPVESTQNRTALSHFSIRVPASQRDLIRADLWRQGIDVGTLFPFPDHLLRRKDFANAAAAASEVLNLPLSDQLCNKDVITISNALRRCATAESVNSPPCPSTIATAA